MKIAACRFRALCRLFFFSAAMLGTGALSVAAQSPFDVVGLNPGMTEPDVLTALAAYRPNPQVQKNTVSYTFSDGVQQLSTESFLHEIHAIYDDAQGYEEFRIYFSPPPSDSRVVSITRQVNLSVTTAPAQTQLSVQLNQKYGTPTTTGKNYDELKMVWSESGKPMCWRATPNIMDIGDGNGPVSIPSGLVARDCGMAVSATVKGDPATRLTVRITDYGMWTTSQQQANAWVQQQEQDAIEARISRGSAGPRL